MDILRLSLPLVGGKVGDSILSKERIMLLVRDYHSHSSYSSGWAIFEATKKSFRAIFDQLNTSCRKIDGPGLILVPTNLENFYT